MNTSGNSTGSSGIGLSHHNRHGSISGPNNQSQSPHNHKVLKPMNACTDRGEFKKEILSCVKDLERLEIVDKPD